MDAILTVAALLFGFLLSFFVIALVHTLRDVFSPRRGLALKYMAALSNLNIRTYRDVNHAGDIILTCYKDNDTVEAIRPRLKEIIQATQDNPILDDCEGHAQLTFVNTPTAKRKKAPREVTAPAVLRPTTG